jgi:glycyl-tRNA synthetase
VCAAHIVAAGSEEISVDMVMAEKVATAREGILEKVTSLCKRRGFVYPNSEIYGGVAGVYDFGPLGRLFRQNLKDHWWRVMTQLRDDCVGIDGAILTHPRVWEASGHVEGFSDPMVDCKQCKRRFRADHMEEEGHTRCPVCGGEFTEPRRFNLLMSTELGVVEGEKMTTYLRGEACQNIYLDFHNVLDSSRLKLPFGICQIGKAFRNEVTLGPFVMRQREFEQWDTQWFCHPNDMDRWYDYWKLERFAFYQRLVNQQNNIRLRKHADKELAFYAKVAYDIEFDTPGLGWKEWEGIHWRADHDLGRHAEYSGKDLRYTDQETGERYIPHIVEASGGVDRTFFFMLMDAYTEEPDKEGVRVVLRLKNALAPIKVAVLPLSKKEPLTLLARAVHKSIQPLCATQYDETTAIGRRYRRQDEIGTPYCVTVDFASIDDRCVTVRERDSMAQERIPIDGLPSYLGAKLLEDQRALIEG